MPVPCRFPPTPRPKNVTERIRRLAERQDGVISRTQLEQCGLSGTGVGRWVAAGRLLRIHRGVYALGHRAVGTRGRLAAALLHAGRGAALSHTTAAWWWQIIRHEPSQIHIVTPGRAGSLPGVQVHRSAQTERVWLRGLPVTPVSPNTS
jgi:predicted transcriptional regulator of viral defense system